MCDNKIPWVHHTFPQSAMTTEAFKSTNCSSSSATTRMTKFKVEHRWKIEEFTTYRRHFQPCDVLKSEEFYAFEHDMRFHVLIYPAGDRGHQQERTAQKVDRWDGKLSPVVCLKSAPIFASSWKEGSVIMIDAEVNIIKKDQTKDLIWCKYIILLILHSTFIWFFVVKMYSTQVHTKDEQPQRNAKVVSFLPG